MASRPRKLLAVGLALAVLASMHWLWLASTDRDTASAIGGFTAAVVVIVVALVWSARTKDES